MTEKKFHIASANSILIQAIAGFILFITFLINLYFNWGYFDGYSGPHNSSYYFAQIISCVSLYGGLITAATFSLSVLFYFKRK